MQSLINLPTSLLLYSTYHILFMKSTSRLPLSLSLSLDFSLSLSLFVVFLLFPSLFLAFIHGHALHAHNPYLLSLSQKFLIVRERMEKKQLNLSAPLLSARRFSSPSRMSEGANKNPMKKSPPNKQNSLPAKKLEWDAEVTKPAAVPFHWEKMPGRPKGESQSHLSEEPSNTPKLPPGRLSDSIRYNSGEIPRLPPGRLSDAIRCNSGESPRLPPGRLSDAMRYNSGESPRLHSGRIPGGSRYNSGDRTNDKNVNCSQLEVLSFKDHASLLAKLNESLKCNDESDAESQDDVYSDAADSLSQMESWSLNYSVSGLSGYQGSDVKPSGTFSVDHQTRDFMMNRFIPAAKAAVLEIPQFAVKKQPAVAKQPEQFKKMVSGERKPLPKQDSPNANIMTYNSQYIENVESEEDDQESIVPSRKSWKSLKWGILPRFCVKNSLCLLNPLPGIKSKSRAPSPAASETKRLTRKAHSGPLDKSAFHVIQKKKFHSGVLSRDLVGRENKLALESNQFSYSSDSYKAGLSPLRRYRSGQISPYRNESPKSPFREGMGFLGVPKDSSSFKANDKIASSRKLCKALQDVSRKSVHKLGSSPPHDAVEKTLYIDSMTTTDCSKDKKHAGKEYLTWKEENHKVKSLDDKSSPWIRKNLSHNPSGVPDMALPAAYVSDLIGRANGKENLKLNQSPGQEPKTSKLDPDAMFGVKDETELGLDDQGESDPALLKSPLPPPLPKSPSESWLWCTVPSIPLKNPFAHSRHSSPYRQRKQDQKGTIVDTKWETIVKTSNLQHDHVRYSQELVPRVALCPTKHRIGRCP